MKNIFFLFLSLILFNCSSSNSNDNTNDSSSKTFLENYTGTVWLQDNSQTYLRFINNLSAPIETWSESTDCYSYELLNLVENPVEIIENLGNIFVLTYDDGGGYKGTFTLTVTGNNLELVDEYELLGDSGIDIINYSKTSIDVDVLIKCDSNEPVGDCQICEIDLLGTVVTGEYCDNGDGTLTVTIDGVEETESLDGLTFDDFITAFEQLGATCN